MVHTVLLALGLAVTDDPAQSFSVADYRQLLLTQRGQIKSMSGTYESRTVPDAIAEKANSMRGVGGRSVITFAWSGEKRRQDASEEWITQDGQKGSSVTTNVYNGLDFRRRQAKTLYLQQSKSGYTDTNAYLNAIRWPITDGDMNEVRHSPADSQFLPYCLEAPDWRVLPGTESVGGVSCLVLEQGQGKRRLWLDPRRGYCLVRLTHEKPMTGQVRWVNEYREFREVMPGFFLPMHVVCNTHIEDDPSGPKGVLTARIRVTDLQVNNVPNSLFVLEPKSGDTVIDTTKNQVYTYIPTDDYTLDDAAARAQERVSSVGRRQLWWQILTFTAAGAVGIGLSYAAFRLWGRKAQPVT